MQLGLSSVSQSASFAFVEEFAGDALQAGTRYPVLSLYSINVRLDALKQFALLLHIHRIVRGDYELGRFRFHQMMQLEPRLFFTRGLPIKKTVCGELELVAMLRL